GLTIADLAYTRSGEKGETINIAVIARSPEHLPPLRAALTEAAIAAHFLDLAYTRSGEKGETINIAVIARKAEYLTPLRAALTEAAIAAYFPDLAPTAVTIHDVPGIHALNIVLEGALPGGINASQRLDPAAKSFGQRLLGMGIEM
ncbi:MAG: hypothetical protein RL481_870, partial [Pseudomonadota bacterium]